MEIGDGGGAENGDPENGTCRNKPQERKMQDLKGVENIELKVTFPLIFIARQHTAADARY